MIGWDFGEGKGERVQREYGEGKWRCGDGRIEKGKGDEWMGV